MGYRNLLWIWHRLNVDRWAQSQVQLRLGKSKPALEVDHTVSFSLWTNKLQSGLPTGITDEDDAKAIVNRLGNCNAPLTAFGMTLHVSPSKPEKHGPNVPNVWVNDA